MDIIRLDLHKRESQLSIKARHLEALGHECWSPIPDMPTTRALGCSWNQSICARPTLPPPAA